MDPRIATQYARKPEYARPFFQYVADVTVQKITMTVEAERGGLAIDVRGRLAAMHRRKTHSQPHRRRIRGGWSAAN